VRRIRRTRPIGNPCASANLSSWVSGDPSGIAASAPGATGLGGVTITLTDTDLYGEAVTLPTVTAMPGDGSGLPVGAYQFPGLLPGTYKITEGGAAGFQPVGASVGIAGNGVISAQQIASIGLGPGSQAGGYNFGEKKPAVTFAAAVPVGSPQPPLLILTFTGDVAASAAANPASYTLVLPRGRRKPVRIPIRAIRYNAASQTAVLVPRHRLNRRARYQVTVQLPGDPFTPPSVPSQVVVVP
jgi:hypothetical protein